MTQSTDYTYADGNANVYQLKGNVLAYIPVKPEESSTGMYSGGEPRTMTLSTSQLDSLTLLMEQAIRNTSVHQQDRAKGTGAITRIAGNEKHRYILRQGCREIEIIESALKKLLR